MPPRTSIPADLGLRPFTRADACLAGVSEGVLRGSRFRRIFRGVYVRADVPETPMLRLDAALLLAPPGAVATHLSAADVYGLPVPRHREVHLSVVRGQLRSRTQGIVVHEYSALPQCLLHQGRPVTAPEQMFLQLAGMLGLVDLVVVGDALVRCRLTTPEQLRAVTDSASGRHVRPARRAALLVRRRVDSPMETRLRLLVVLAGLPEPEANVEVHGPDGGWLACPDLRYAEQRIAIEYDGQHHLLDRRQWERDIARRENLERAGWLVLVVTATDLFRRPGPTLMRILDALHRRGHPSAPGRPSMEWAHYF